MKETFKSGSHSPSPQVKITVRTELTVPAEIFQWNFQEPAIDATGARQVIEDIINSTGTADAYEALWELELIERPDTWEIEIEDV